MEDIGKTISTWKKLTSCNDIEEVRKLRRKYEDRNLEQDMEKFSMLSLDELIERTKALVNKVKGLSNYGKFPERIDLDVFEKKRSDILPTSKLAGETTAIRKYEELYEQTKALVQKVEKVFFRGIFPGGIALDVFEEKRDYILPTSKLVGETTAIRNMEKIYDFLIGDVRKIGVYGMGGIGKTTVMKHINNRFLKEKGGKFDCVIWVNVSKASSVFKLQDDIAWKLNVDLSNYINTTIRAGALLEAFKKKGRWLLILDDLWEGYSLEDVGIPDPDFTNGCKLALTTRSFDVCQSMKCEAIHMDLLSKEEAWSLFLHHVGDYVLEIKDLVPIVRDVASECARLPLAIAIIATSMAGKQEVCEWRDALAKLRGLSNDPGDKGKRVIEQLKFNYDLLVDEKLKKCLLLCALYPEDFYIKRRELVELLVLEGIIEEKESMWDEIDEGNVIVNNLIDQYLLEGGKTSKEYSWVKMHDLVRDVTLQSDGLHSKYLTVSGIELSNVKWSEELLKIHISNCYSLNVSPMCPRLTTFILQDHSLRNIPDSFFLHFKALKVLNLSGCGGLQVLPNSISELVNLVGLLLRDCSNLRYVPPLTRLKDLQSLDLSLTITQYNSYLFEGVNNRLPEGLEELSKLRYLNLILFQIKVFPPGIIPRFSNLRFLVCNPLTKVTASELMDLKNLEMFKGAFHDIHDLCVYDKHREQKRSQLASYAFLVGSTPKYLPLYFDAYGDNSFVKVVKLANCNLGKLTSESDEHLLPKDVQMLQIECVPDITSLCAMASLNYATDLRICHIRYCNEVRELVSTSSCSSFVLPNIESLELVELENLEALIGKKMKVCNVFSCLREMFISGCPRMNLEANKKQCNAFSCLRELYISRCPRLKVVINIGLLSNFNNLEKLTVVWCSQLKEIIGESVDDDDIDVKEGMAEITLPNLRHLSLIGLPRLRSLSPASRPLICKSLEYTYIDDCPELEQGGCAPSDNNLKSPKKKKKTDWVASLVI